MTNFNEKPRPVSVGDKVYYSNGYKRVMGTVFKVRDRFEGTEDEGWEVEALVGDAPISFHCSWHMVRSLKPVN